MRKVTYTNPVNGLSAEFSSESALMHLDIKGFDGASAGGKGLDKSGGSGIIISDKQRGKKIGEHARQWGLDPSVKEDRERLIAIITDIFASPDEVRIGSYRGQLDEVLFFCQRRKCCSCETK